MFLDFFLLLKEEGLPVSIGEYLNLLEALNKRVTAFNVEEFYFLSKTILIKHEQFLDRYDLLFGKYFHNIELEELEKKEIPADWLQKEMNRLFTDEEKALIEKMGGLDKLMERLKELMEEQKEKHQGGSKWIGTGGTSPFGNNGFNPEGVRIGGGGGGRTAVKIWEKREFQNYSSDVELNTRNIKLALKRLRILTREGIEDELDLHTTIEKTCKNAGYLDIEMQPSKKNRVKVLLFFDVGGSMDPYVELCEQLFSAAKSELKHLEFFYFHNCVYESIWKDNNMRYNDRIPTFDILHKFNQDYRVIFVGDATMSPYELTALGGSVEHYNDETGVAWLQRFVDKFPNIVWLNPSNEYYWDGLPTVQIIKELFKDRMYAMTLDGLAKAMKTLKGKKVAH
ncbi:MAG: VWA domain-containing protein [Sphingobacteriales bacterium]|nr:VWA domain-containing protein [Sphingobacteriales bacterium]